MTLQQIKYFIKTAECGSTSDAAKSLYVGTSSISTAIKELETQLGVTAFKRDSKGVQLTEAGKELLLELRVISDQVDYLERKYDHLQQQKQNMTLSSALTLGLLTSARKTVTHPSL